MALAFLPSVQQVEGEGNGDGSASPLKEAIGHESSPLSGEQCIPQTKDVDCILFRKKRYPPIRKPHTHQKPTT